MNEKSEEKPINTASEEIQEPNILTLGVSYTLAIAKWMSEGRPVRTFNEVEHIFNEICLPCPYFNLKRQTCKVCGCRMNQSGNPLINKIAMKTESCPKKKWI